MARALATGELATRSRSVHAYLEIAAGRAATTSDKTLPAQWPIRVFRKLSSRSGRDARLTFAASAEARPRAFTVWGRGPGPPWACGRTLRRYFFPAFSAAAIALLACAIAFLTAP